MWFDRYLFLDRTDAGRQLAAKLAEEPLITTADRSKLHVLSIPRGGVMVGSHVAETLGCGHEVLVAKKVGFPGRSELAIGAVAEDGAVIFSSQLMLDYGEQENRFAQEIAQAKAQVKHYIDKFRQGRALNLSNKIVILVDDGMATGETMRAAIKWVSQTERTDRPQAVVVAVPVCAAYTAADLQKLVDRFVCLATPEPFWAVGQFYWDFDEVTDAQVLQFLTQRAAMSLR